MTVDKHEFALYVASLSQHMRFIQDGVGLRLHDEQIAHRVTKVLRMMPGDVMVLFDRVMHVRCVLQENKDRRSLFVHVLTQQHNVMLKPAITCALPLLKKDDLELALYLLAALGVTTIQLLMTQKSIRSWGKEKEFERLERIVIAAAEQSKYFAMPSLCEPLSLEKFCASLCSYKGEKVYFDMHGTSLLQHLVQHEKQPVDSYLLMMGPEGDLTQEEKELVRCVGFSFCKLTPTTLRAVHALCVGVGAFRSL